MIGQLDAARRAKYVLGLIFIILCALIWAGASVMIQYIYENLEFKSPFLVTYLATSLLSLHLLVWYGKLALNHLRQSSSTLSSSEQTMNSFDDKLSLVTIDNSSHPLTNSISFKGDNQADIGQIEQNGSESAIQQEARSATTLEVVKIALIIAPLWFGANCFYNYSLLLTSVSSSTIISNLSASFTMAFSYFIGIEDITYLKLLGVAICFVGAVIVGLQDEDGSQDQTAIGDITALLGSAGYGIYTTAIRLKVPDDDSVSMQLLLGYVGLVNAILLLPALIVVIVLNVDNISNLTGEIFGFITLNGVADTVIADYFWARAVILTSPTIATIGMSITIPIALLTDYLVHGDAASGISILGSFLVIVGFILVNLTKKHQDIIFEYIRRRIGFQSTEPSG